MEHGEQAKTSVTWVFSVRMLNTTHLHLPHNCLTHDGGSGLISGQANQNNKRKGEAKLQDTFFK